MIILLAHAASTLFMTGLIWFVQVVHYPLAVQVGPVDFVGYQTAHVKRTSWVVAGPMLIEAATTAWLLFNPPPSAPQWLVWLGAFLLGVVWTSTALLQVPAHDKLSRGFDARSAALLVHSNWLRTAGWTARACVVLALLALAGGGLQ